MTKRVVQIVTGRQAIDGAGVKLVRVLGYRTIKTFDPFLMLDSFDSHNPDDYVAGFPTHPHRGIETITYLVEGEIDHEDSLGNKGKISPGGMQWMTAGSGILHQEMPQPKKRILGVQLWLNLPKSEKMTKPKYFDIDESMVKTIQEKEATIKIISGNYKGTKGLIPHHIFATIFDVTIHPNQKITIPTIDEETTFIFTLLGNVIIDDTIYQEKSAILFGEGEGIVLSAPQNTSVRLLFVQAKPLHESIAWGGPIVMNTEEELNKAFAELQAGTFIKK